jgi:hypothetical protein
MGQVETWMIDELSFFLKKKFPEFEKEASK